MKLFRTSAIALALAFSAGTALADQTKPAPAPAQTDADKADVQKWLAFFDKIVDTVVKDKDSCPTMAKDVNALVDANQDLLKKANEAVAAGKKLPDDAQKHMMDKSKSLMGAMQKCGQDKDVQAAFMRMQVGASKPSK